MISSGCSEKPGTGNQEAPPFEEIRKIDIHSHIFEDIPSLVQMLQQNNVQIVNICNRGLDGHLEEMHEIAHELYDKYPDLFPYASTFGLENVNEPGFSEEVIQWLDQTYEAGAVMTKIWKEIGMEVKDTSGDFLMPDDPVFGPIYAHLENREIPLLAHIADPIDAWRPLDPESVHYGYYSQNPEWHVYESPDFPSHEELIESRDNILRNHPDLIVIGAHLGSLEHDVEEVARRFDEYPNFYVDVSARTRDLTRQPREKVREFFLNYHDRILYGVDVTWRPYRTGPRTEDEKAAFTDRFEERLRLDYAFYAGTDSLEYAGRKVRGLGLPRDVLENFYSGNARRLLPDLGEI